MQHRAYDARSRAALTPAAICLLLLAGERLKEKPLDRGRTGDQAEVSKCV
jgi:hypothetical protein